MKEKKRKKQLWTVLFWLAIATVVLGCCIPTNLGSITQTTTTKASDTDKKGKETTKKADNKKTSTEPEDTEALPPEDTKETDADEPTDEQPEVTSESNDETEASELTENEDSSAETSATEDPGLSYNDYINMFQNGDYSYVTPSFKESMDSYEEFYDEYIAFMKKYLRGEGNLMEMLEDYYAFIEKEEEMAVKLDAIDDDSLSTADAAYYSYVSLRIADKMLSIYS